MYKRQSSKIEPGRFAIPRDREAIVAQPDGKDVALTNLRKVFFPQTGTTKGDLLQYYADVAPFLVPYMRCV